MLLMCHHVRRKISSCLIVWRNVVLLRSQCIHGWYGVWWCRIHAGKGGWWLIRRSSKWRWFRMLHSWMVIHAASSSASKHMAVLIPWSSSSRSKRWSHPLRSIVWIRSISSPIHSRWHRSTPPKGWLSSSASSSIHHRVRESSSVWSIERGHSSSTSVVRMRKTTPPWSSSWARHHSASSSS